MRAWNRARLLWAYLRGHSKLSGLPVENIVETQPLLRRIGHAYNEAAPRDPKRSFKILEPRTPAEVK